MNDEAILEPHSRSTKSFPRLVKANRQLTLRFHAKKSLLIFISKGNYADQPRE